MIQNKKWTEFGTNFQSPDECQCFLQNDWQLYSHENKRNGSKCKIIDLTAELKKSWLLTKGTQ